MVIYSNGRAFCQDCFFTRRELQMFLCRSQSARPESGSLYCSGKNTVRVPHPFLRSLRKWMGMRRHYYVAGHIGVRLATTCPRCCPPSRFGFNPHSAALPLPASQRCHCAPCLIAGRLFKECLGSTDGGRQFAAAFKCWDHRSGKSKT